MRVTADSQYGFMMATAQRCLQLARSYLIVPERLHRWTVFGVMGMILLLIGCFVSYAFVEKYQLTNHFFYGRVQFSFIDGGYPEIFGYLLELAASVIFLLFAFFHRKKCWYAWSAIMFVVFLDDSFKLHETLGQMYSAGLGISPVVGGLLGFATTGFLSVIFWFIGLGTIATREDFSAYLVFSVYFAVLIFFGVGVDALHELIGQNMSQTAFTLLEDGGELLTIAIIGLSALGMWLQEKHAIATSSVRVGAAL